MTGSLEQRFLMDIQRNTHIYVDIRERIGFAFYFEGRILDVFERERKLYFNQEGVHVEAGFFSLKLPWELMHYSNQIYSLIHQDFRVSILFVNEGEER